jgi:VIT1/CCC1 family predicted Fe2+/Mn2+ transporter
MTSDKVRNVLNILFLIGALVAIIVYFAVDDKKVFFYVSCGAIFFKLIEFFIRFTNR